jgi:hypothetical protein
MRYGDEDKDPGLLGVNVAGWTARNYVTVRLL